MVIDKDTLKTPFHHVVTGDNPFVIEKLCDPAFNLAVWENAARREVIDYFESFTQADIDAILKKSKGSFGEYTRESRDEFCDRLVDALPSKNGKQQTIVFLMQMNDMFYHFLQRPFSANLRFNTGRDVIQGMHADGTDYRAFVSLSRYADAHGDDGSTRFVSNCNAKALMREAYKTDDVESLLETGKAYLANFMIASDTFAQSRPVGVGNVAVFTGTGTPDRFPLFHSRANLSHTQQSPSLARVGYVLSPSARTTAKRTLTYTV